MTAVTLDILEKTKPVEGYPSVSQNFVLRETGEIDARIVVESPNVSLYCLDDENRRALFVETPQVDPVQAPFFYMAQYQHAQRVIAVPYDEMHRLAADIPYRNLIMIYSVGRCGSTLISQALNAAEGVQSLSEPDVYTHINMLRFVDASRDEEYTHLLDSSTRLLARHAPVTAIKFRSGGIHMVDLMRRVCPDAKNLFLYRNANTWAQSMNSAFTADVPPALDDPIFLQFLMSLEPLAGAFIQRQGRPPTVIESYALLWLSVMDSYLKQYRQGTPFYTIRYEDIKAYPQRVLTAVFDYLELNPAAIAAAYAVFSRDSQEGTRLSQAHLAQNPVKALGAEDYAQVAAVLSEHPVIQTADYVAPGTAVFAD